MSRTQSATRAPAPITAEFTTPGTSARKIMLALGQIVHESLGVYDGSTKYYLVAAPVIETPAGGEWTGEGPWHSRTVLRRDDRVYDDEIEWDQPARPNSDYMSAAAWGFLLGVFVTIFAIAAAVSINPSSAQQMAGVIAQCTRGAA